MIDLLVIIGMGGLQILLPGFDALTKKLSGFYTNQLNRGWG